jgi:hypothetical protein
MGLRIGSVFAILTVLTSGCALDATEAESEPEVVDEVENAGYDPRYLPDDTFRDPCLYGTQVTISGQTFQVPAYCRSYEGFDRGDPGPEQPAAVHEAQVNEPGQY